MMNNCGESAVHGHGIVNHSRISHSCSSYSNYVIVPELGSETALITFSTFAAKAFDNMRDECHSRLKVRFDWCSVLQRIEPRNEQNLQLFKNNVETSEDNVAIMLHATCHLASIEFNSESLR